MKFLVGALVGVMMILGLEARAQVTAPESCLYTCSPGCVEYANYLKSTARDIMAVCGVTNPGPVPGPVPRPGATIEFYYSDTCSSGLVAVADPYTDCRAMGGNDSVWGIKVNGRCHNIADTTLTKACQAYRDIDTPGGTEFYYSDSCSSGLVAVVSSKFRCDEIGRTLGSAAVWGIKVNGGQCQNIADTDFLTACRRFVR